MYNISSLFIRNYKPLASFCGCAGRFESYLVEYPEDGFSREQGIDLYFDSFASVADPVFRRNAFDS